MWVSRTKADLIIEVWEKLDCESVGASEIEAIDEAVRSRFGAAAVESPMRTARLLADEGAMLRHAEIMHLWVKRCSDLPHEAEFKNLLRLSTLREARASLRNVENLRRKFATDNDKEGLRLLRDEVLDAKKRLLRSDKIGRPELADRAMKTEVGEWLAIWLQSPDIFDNWVRLRQMSNDFRIRFPDAE